MVSKSRYQSLPATRREGVFSFSGFKKMRINKETCACVAQMDNTEVTDFEATVSVDNKAVTTFYESAPVVEGTSSRTTNEMSTYLETYVDIKSFLLRPYLIWSGQWNVSQPLNTNLGTGEIAQLLTNVPMWADKIKGFNLIRGDFMIKIQINATPFHQGKLLLHYLPNWKNIKGLNTGMTALKNAELVQKIQHPHIEIDCRKTSVVLRIPYIAPSPWYSMKEKYFDWGTWFLDVFSPLQTGTLGEGFVDYLVYGWFENIELNAPVVPQSDNTERRTKIKNRGGEVEECAENQGPITMGLRKASKVANVFSDIPVISEFAKPVEWVTNLLSGVTSSFGWSKPRELNGQTIVAQQLFRYAGTCDGPDLAFPGGVSALNRLETIDYGSFTTEDEMSLSYLYKIPYYVGEFLWDPSSGQGSTLYTQKISPLSFLKTGSYTTSGHTMTYEYHVPFTYLARMHSLWRGGMILTLKFIKTQMHSGRIQVTWNPLNIPGAAPDIQNSAFMRRAIIDIRTEDTISLELPYLLYTDYLNTTVEGFTSVWSGQVDIKVLNNLRAPETCSQNVNVQVFISAAEDYELAAPSQFTAGNSPFIAQSDGKEILRDSVYQGLEMPTMEIGGKATTLDPLFHSKRCTGEKVLSIKSYLLRNSVIQGLGGVLQTLDWTTTDQVMIDPYFLGATKLTTGTGFSQGPTFGGDHLSLFGLWYTYMRGGIRMTVVDSNMNNRLYANVIPVAKDLLTSGVSTPFTTTFTTNSGVYGINANPTVKSGIYPLQPCHVQDQTSYVYQHIPYYNRFPMNICHYYNGADTPFIDPSRPLSKFVVKGSTNFSKVVFQRAVADDFQLMFFTGCPPLPTAYT